MRKRQMQAGDEFRTIKQIKESLPVYFGVVIVQNGRAVNLYGDPRKLNIGSHELEILNKNIAGARVMQGDEENRRYSVLIRLGKKRFFNIPVTDINTKEGIEKHLARV
jgi:hypothetical protein